LTTITETNKSWSLDKIRLQLQRFATQWSIQTLTHELQHKEAKALKQAKNDSTKQQNGQIAIFFCIGWSKLWQKVIKNIKSESNLQSRIVSCLVQQS